MDSSEFEFDLAAFADPGEADVIAFPPCMDALQAKVSPNIIPAADTSGTS